MIGFLVLYKVSWIYLKTSLLVKSELFLFSNYLISAPAQKAFLTLLNKTITLTSFELSNSFIFLTRFDFIYALRALKSFWLSIYIIPILFSTFVYTFVYNDFETRLLKYLKFLDANLSIKKDMIYFI